MEKETEIKLDLSENMFGFSDKIIDVLTKEIRNTNLYPDTNCEELINCISKYFGIMKERIYVGNGLDEIILTIAISKKYKNVLVPEHSFMGYAYSTKLSGAEIKEIKLENYKISLSDLYDKIDDVDAIYICNPQNPFGTVLEYASLVRLIEKCEEKNVDLIVDEAYIDFIQDENVHSVINLTNKYKCLYVLRTFSKAYSLAGLRCGFLVSDENNLTEIFEVRNALPFSVNRLAQKAACCALENDTWVKDNINVCKKNRKFFMEKLREINIPFIESNANFVTVYSEKADCIRERLFEEYRIKVKDLNGMGLSNYLRIGIGTKKQMESVVEVLQELYGA